MIVTSIFVSITSIFTILLIRTDMPITYVLQPSFEMFGFLCGIILLLSRFYFFLLPPITHFEWTKILRSASSFIWEIYFMFQISRNSVYKNILTFLIILLVKSSDIAISLKSKSAMKKEMETRKIVRLVHAIFILLIVIIASLYINRNVISGIANTLWFEFLYHSIHVLLSLILLCQPFLFNEKRCLTIQVIIDSLSELVRFLVIGYECYYFIIHKDIFLVRSVPICFMAFAKFVKSLSQIKTLWNVSTFNEIQLHQPEVCVICQNTTEMGVILPCNHIFHKTCISEWIVRSNRCPICQQEIKTGHRQEEEENNMILQWNIREF